MTRLVFTHLFQVLAPEAYCTKELIQLLILLPPSSSPTSPIATTFGRLGTTIFGCWQGMHAATGHADGNKSITNLAHNNTPVSASLDGGTNCCQLGFPIGVDMICAFPRSWPHD